ncbi:MAG: efflux RND transporter permease subunit [bacterium]|nr:efflux RND transporter permease subunit [bacterium]
MDPLTGQPRLRIDPSLNEMLPADDPARRFYEELLDRFGSDDVVVVALISDALFTRDGLATLERTSEALALAPGVRRVESLATAVRMRPIEDDVEIAGFFDDPIEDDEAARVLRDELIDDPLRAGSFVSIDGRATAILVTFERVPEDEFLARGLDLGVLEIARAEAPEMQVVMAGTPHVKAEVGRLLEGELAVMVPIVFVLMSILSCVFFRSLRLGMIPLAAVATGLLWTVGVMGWVGHDLNIVTTLIPPLVLALGFAYATHVVAGFAADGEAGSRDDRARRALAHVAFPVTFTALTTAAGFLSLISNELGVIRGFGVFAAVSTAATLLAALTLVPLLLSRTRGEAVAGSNPTTDFLDARFAALADLDARHATPILWIGAGLVVLAFFFATRIEVNLPVIENFREDAEIRRAYETVDELFGGANQFFVMLRAEERRAFEDPALLREVAAFQTWLAEQPEIGGSTSVVQYLEVLNAGLGPEAGAVRRIPDSANLVAQLLLFGANEELDVLLDRAHQVITILVRSTATETSEFNRLAARIDARLAELPAGITSHTTGNAILLTRSADRIALGQAKSLAWAGAMIGVLLIFYFRSLRLGLFALLPNLLPVGLYFGLLGATGITLNNSTALMGSIVLGIAVDDTLHLVVEFRRGLEAGLDREAALREALVRVGRAITCTTLAVCVGLLVVGASALQNQAEFGLLGATTLLIAWLVDVTITPALCLRYLDPAGAPD